MKKKVDATELFGDYTPPSYSNSRDYIESRSIERLIELLYLIEDSNNYDSDDLVYIAELNYQFNEDGVILPYLDSWQMNGLTKEIEQVLLQKILSDYEKNLDAEEKIITLYK